MQAYYNKVLNQLYLPIRYISKTTMRIKFLKAFNGDSILISFKDGQRKDRNILVDGGISATYQTKKDKKGKKSFGDLGIEIDRIRQLRQRIDLLILTHIDDDHIAGIIAWFDDDLEAHKLVKQVWFNSGASIAKYLKKKENKDLAHYINPTKKKRTSINQGIEFSKHISSQGIWKDKVIVQGDKMRKLGMVFKFLSPNQAKLEKLLKEWKKKDPRLKTSAKEDDYKLSLKEHIENDNFEEDKAFPNGSSIAFILEYMTNVFLFLGDSHPSVVAEGLHKFGYSSAKPIVADLVKLAHHGSSGNTDAILLNMITAKNFMVSTNGMTHQHPHKAIFSPSY